MAKGSVGHGAGGCVRQPQKVGGVGHEEGVQQLQLQLAS